MKKFILLVLLGLIISCSEDDSMNSREENLELEKTTKTNLDLANDNRYSTNGSYTTNNCVTGNLELETILEIELNVVTNNYIDGVRTTYEFEYNNPRPFTNEEFVNSCDIYKLRLEIAKGDINPSTGDPYDAANRCYVLRDINEPYPLKYYNYNLGHSATTKISFEVETIRPWNCFYYRFVLVGQDCGNIIYADNPLDPDNPFEYDNTFNCDAYTEWIYYQS